MTTKTQKRIGAIFTIPFALATSYLAEECKAANPPPFDARCGDIEDLPGALVEVVASSTATSFTGKGAVMLVIGLTVSSTSSAQF